METIYNTNYFKDLETIAAIRTYLDRHTIEERQCILMYLSNFYETERDKKHYGIPVPEYGLEAK